MEGDETKPEDQRERAQRALKTFLDSQTKVSSSTDKSAKAAAALADRIGDDRQGLIAVIADLIDALDAHREEIKLFRAAILKAGGVNIDIASILGGGRRGR
jgi:hypothetical protein